MDNLEAPSLLYFVGIYYRKPKLDPGEQAIPVYLFVGKDRLTLCEIVQPGESLKNKLGTFMRNHFVIADVPEVFTSELKVLHTIERPTLNYKWSWMNTFYFRSNLHDEFSVVEFREINKKGIFQIWQSGHKAKQMMKLLGY